MFNGRTFLNVAVKLQAKVSNYNKLLNVDGPFGALPLIKHAEGIKKVNEYRNFQLHHRVLSTVRRYNYFRFAFQSIHTEYM